MARVNTTDEASDAAIYTEDGLDFIEDESSTGGSMAVTGAALQTALGTNATHPKVIREFGVFGTTQQWLIAGNTTVGGGRTRHVSTTAASNAATQAGEVLTALRAG